MTEDHEERLVKAIETIARETRRMADAFSWVARCSAADDQGRPAIRIAGEIVGGDGDVTAGI